MPEVDLEQALEQIFLLCESGVASTIQFIIDSHPGVVRLLNDRRPCFIIDTSMDLTVLQLATACGQVDVIRTLLHQPDISVNAADPMYLMTALHLAVHLGQTFALEELCRDGRLLYEEKTIKGKTALHLAVAQGYAHIVETILRLHPTADLRARDFDGNNVFHLAAYNPNARVMSLLVNHAQLVSLYSSSFETKDSEKSNRRATAGPHILNVRRYVPLLSPRRSYYYILPSLQVLNYNKQSVNSILTSAIKRVQFPKSAQQQHQLSLSAEPQLSHLPSSAAVAALKFPEECEVPNTTTAPSSSSDESQSAVEDADLEVLLKCLEIVRAATQVFPQPLESPSTCGQRTASPERKCSFDLDSLPSDASNELHGVGGEGGGGRVVRTERTAYSWSPRCTPSLDPPDSFYTPRSSHSP
jgi:hypothetical protein